MSYAHFGEPPYDDGDLMPDDDDYRERGEDAWGCAFGERCCMPGMHTVDECHTPEMAEEAMREALNG